ncbi:MAG: general secretion pathway protein GspK [Synergistaceae bacterium]|nr:general secretion pathway protein GspK [Synergistaceae bacterium]
MWTPSFLSRGKKPGFVLVAVLMSVTVLVTGALAFAWFARMEVRKSEAIAFSLEARSLAETAVREIQRGIVLDTNGYDSLLEPWFGAWPLPVEGRLAVFVRLVPKNDALPVNSLFLPDGTTLRREMEIPWQRLWEELKKPELAEDLLDFLDRDTTPRPGGGEDSSFINRAPSALGELRLFPAIDETLYNGNNEKTPKGLNVFLTVDTDGRINVNVAAPEVLGLLDPALTPAVIREIVEKRSREPLAGWNDLAEVPGFPGDLEPRLSGLLSFTSSHFLAQIEVRKGDLVRRFEAVLLKKQNRCTIVAWKEM